MPKLPKARVQVEISDRAKRNLQLYALLAECTLGEALDEILLEATAAAATARLGPEKAAVFERAEQAI